MTRNYFKIFSSVVITVTIIFAQFSPVFDSYSVLAEENINPELLAIDMVGNPSDRDLIDKTAPKNLQISYSKALTEKVLEGIIFSFYKPDVTVTFSANDDISGVKSFIWSYKEESAENKNVAQYAYAEEEITELWRDPEDPTRFTASITFPKEKVDQLRGHITVKAVDNCGNESFEIVDEGHVIVVDSISPECDIKYEEPKYEIDGKLYYNKAVNFLLNVKEANFFAEDFRLDMEKDGGKIDKNLIWNNVCTEEHVANLLLDEDGEYKLTANYTDKSKNKAETHSLNVVIDKTAPVLDIAFDQKTQSTIFTIKEQNFVPENILLRLSAKDISGKGINTKELEEKLTHDLQCGEWECDGNTYKFTISDYVDGIYSLKLLCKDLLYNESELCVVFNIQKMTN